MDSQNIKVYLGISFALIILFVLIIIIPFSKKSTNNGPQPTSSIPFPTTIETNPSQNNQVNNNLSPIIQADFTGVAEEELPPQVLDAALQKKDLRQKTPLDLSTFVINFDYSEDKFVVTLKDPRDQSQKEFESWRLSNYPGLGSEQFTFR